MAHKLACLFSFLTLLALAAALAFAATWNAFGTQTYQHGQTASAEFTLLDPAAPYVIRVERLQAASTATVTLNGAVVVTPAEIAASAIVEKNISPAASNTLNVAVDEGGSPADAIRVTVIGTDNANPTANATVSPAPNAAAWSNSDITITLTCTDATSGLSNCYGSGQSFPCSVGAASCQLTLPLTSEITGIYQFAAGDRAGLGATGWLMYRIDKTAPTLNVSSPPDGVVTTNASLDVAGTASDARSGLSGVTCNGAAATVTSGAFTCNVTLSAGANALTLVATDVAENTTTVIRNVTLAPSISSFSPASAAYGETVTVNGAGFVTPSANPQVTLNKQGSGTVTALILSATDSVITFVVPTGAATGLITVTTAGYSATSASPLVIAPLIQLQESVEVSEFTRVTVDAEVSDPSGGALTYSWTQTAGPAVQLVASNPPTVSFLAPAGDTEVTLRLTASTAAASASRDVTINVVSFASEAGLRIGYGEADTSQIGVSNTSLRPGFLWGRTDTALELSFTSDDGAVLVQGPAIGPLVYLKHADGYEEVTAMFQYTTAENKLTLNTLQTAAFRALLKQHPMEVHVTGEDTAGNSVQLFVPLMNGAFQLNGVAALAPGVPAEPLAGTIVAIQGIDSGWTSTTTLDSAGAFSFDSLPAGMYTVDILTANGLFGAEFAELTAPGGGAVNVSITLTSGGTVVPLAANRVTTLQARGLPAPQLAFRTLARSGARETLEYGSKVFATADVANSTDQATVTIPQGTSSVSVGFYVGSSLHREDFFFDPCHTGISGVVNAPGGLT